MSFRLTLFCCWLALVALSLPGPARATGQVENWTHQGVAVYHFPVAQLPIVDVRLWFRAGSAYSQNNHSVAFLTNQVIGYGAGKLNEAELDLQLGLIGARFHRGIDRDGAWLGIRTMSGKLKPALAQLRQIATAPRWQQASLDLLRESNRARITRALEDGSSRLSLESFRMLYGKHPYAQMVSGDLKSNEAATLAQLKKFYQRHYTTQNMRVLVVGAIDRKSINAWLDGLVGQLPAGQASDNPDWVKQTPLPMRRHIAIDSSQVHWNALSLGVARTSADYPLMTLALFLLDKRLDVGLRDELGLTYSAGAFAHKLLGRGMLRIYFSTRAQSAGAAVEAANTLMREFFQQELPPEELEKAKTHLTGLLSISYNSNQKILDLLQIIAQEDLPLDYLGRLIWRIAGATPEEVNDFIHRYFSHRRFSEVSTGPEIQARSASNSENSGRRPAP